MLDGLCNGRKRMFRLNEETIGYLRGITWSKAAWRKIQSWESEQDWEEAAFLERLDDVFTQIEQTTAQNNDRCGSSLSVSCAKGLSSGTGIGLCGQRLSSTGWAKT